MCEAAGGCFIDQFKNWSIPLFSSCSARRECKRIPPSPPKIPNAQAFGIFTYYFFTIHSSLRSRIRDFWEVICNSEE